MVMSTIRCNLPHSSWTINASNRNGCVNSRSFKPNNRPNFRLSNRLNFKLNNRRNGCASNNIFNSSSFKLSNLSSASQQASGKFSIYLANKTLTSYFWRIAPTTHLLPCPKHNPQYRPLAKLQQEYPSPARRCHSTLQVLTETALGPVCPHLRNRYLRRRSRRRDKRARPIRTMQISPISSPIAKMVSILSAITDSFGAS